MDSGKYCVRFVRSRSSLEDVYFERYATLHDDDSDTLLTMTTEVMPADISRFKKIFAVEKLDGVEIKARRLLVENPSVRIVKQYKYISYETYNSPSIGGRVFCASLSPGNPAAKTPQTRITPEIYSRIILGASFWHFFRHKYTVAHCSAKPPPPHDKRSIDYFFAGTTTYGKEDHASGLVIQEHRRAAISAIDSLGRRGFRCLYSPSRSYTYPEYLNILYNTRYIISPFGWGEMCYRDYEALICGCTLIKPKANDIAGNPDISRYTRYISPAFDIDEIVLASQTPEDNGQAVINILINTQNIYNDILNPEPPPGLGTPSGM